MARQATGQVIEPNGKQRSWALRFRAYGKRRFVSFGRPEEGWTRERAEAELIYIAEQMGHTDPHFTFRVYQRAVKRRERLTGAHLRAFDQALEWARTGRTGQKEPSLEVLHPPNPAPSNEIRA